MPFFWMSSDAEKKMRIPFFLALSKAFLRALSASASWPCSARASYLARLSIVDEMEMMSTSRIMASSMARAALPAWI